MELSSVRGLPEGAGGSGGGGEDRDGLGALLSEALSSTVGGRGLGRETRTHTQGRQLYSVSVCMNVCNTQRVCVRSKNSTHSTKLWTLLYTCVCVCERENV